VSARPRLPGRPGSAAGTRRYRSITIHLSKSSKPPHFLSAWKDYPAYDQCKIMMVAEPGIFTGKFQSLALSPHHTNTDFNVMMC
jgi:hypothetical protein